MAGLSVIVTPSSDQLRAMLSTLSRKTNTLKRELRNKGVARVAHEQLDGLATKCLALHYGFPPAWHPPTSARPYRTAIANAVSALQPQVVCEVGCGLGAILSRIRAPVRHGYDIDPGVIDAARLLRPRDIRFVVGGLGDVQLDAMDVLITVNWIHELSPQQLEHLLLPLLPRTRYLVLDAIDPDNDFGYAYKHDFAFLAGRAIKLQGVRHPEEGREFPIYQVL